MKLRLLSLAFIAIVLISCSKDTATVDTGTIRYVNQSLGGNRYELFLDGAGLGLLSANKYFDKGDIPAGSHIVKSVQYEGYVLYPTVNEETIVVSKGVTVQFQFQFQ